MGDRNLSPPLLEKGDKIGIISTARKISPEEIAPAIKVFQSWGLIVVKGQNLHAEDNQFAGDDSQRLQDIQEMLDDPDIRAVICARGGYGTARIIDHIDFSGFLNAPKWIAGYSDVTALHSHIHTNFGIETLHSPMPLNFPVDGSENESVLSLKKALFQEQINYEVNDFEVFNDNGFETITGELTGGNLSMLYSLIGSPSDINTKQKILFIEDLDEYLYHIDRMMLNLMRSGKLSHIKALMVGWMSDMNDNTIPFGKNAHEIIRERMQKTNIPVIFGFPAGHLEPNLSLILGRKIRINRENILTLSM
ncbi:MAG: S66 peptidase family protein [Bacteroidales bacterium]